MKIQPIIILKIQSVYETKNLQAKIINKLSQFQFHEVEVKPSLNQLTI